MTELAQDQLKKSGYEIIETGKLFSDLFMIRCNVDKRLIAMFLSDCASAGCRDLDSGLGPPKWRLERRLPEASFGSLWPSPAANSESEARSAAPASPARMR